MQKWRELRGEIDSNTVTVGGFNNPPVMDRTSREDKGTEGLNNTLFQMDLPDIFRTSHPAREQHICFSSAHETCSRIDYGLSHKTSLNKFKKAKIIPGIFSYHNGIKLEMNNRRKTGKFTLMWKLNNILLNDQQVKEEIKRN